MSHDERYSGPSERVNTLTRQIISSSSRADPDALDDEALFAELEAELENEGETERERGIKELQREMERVTQMKQDMHGKYTEVTDEKELIRISANEPRCIVHFYHSNFRRCEIMDKHLSALAPKYFGTRFMRVFVESVPFLVEKLGIKVLPCVISFVNGVTKDRIIGFEELGNSDAFNTSTLELRLEQTGVIQKETQFMPAVQHVNSTVSRSNNRFRKTTDDDDSDFDL